MPAHARDHGRQLGGHHDQVVAAFHRSRREGAAGAVHADLDAVLVRGVADPVAGRHVHRVRVVGARVHPEREGQVGRPDIDGVEPRRGADRVEVGEAFLGLDHAHDHDLVVGLGQVVGAAVVHRAHRAGGAHAHRRIAARGHRLRRVLGGIDQRHQDAVGAEVQRLHDGGRVIPGHAHHRHGVGLRDRLEHRPHVVHVGEPVLHVHHQGVEALAGHDLRGEPVGDREPAHADPSSLAPDLLHLVRSHDLTS